MQGILKRLMRRLPHVASTLYLQSKKPDFTRIIGIPHGAHIPAFC